ncbi:MAG: flagellar hook-length control protein FliK [Actinomycetota bacterium]|nr:flagellar hook-length control protein FliK [Actinomycetota bacterium]
MTISPTTGVPDRAATPREQSRDPDDTTTAEFMAALAAFVFPTATTAGAGRADPSALLGSSRDAGYRPREVHRADRETTGADPRLRRPDRSHAAERTADHGAERTADHAVERTGGTDRPDRSVRADRDPRSAAGSPKVERSAAAGVPDGRVVADGRAGIGDRVGVDGAGGVEGRGTGWSPARFGTAGAQVTGPTAAGRSSDASNAPTGPGAAFGLARTGLESPTAPDEGTGPRASAPTDQGAPSPAAVRGQGPTADVGAGGSDTRSQERGAPFAGQNVTGARPGAQAGQPAGAVPVMGPVAGQVASAAGRAGGPVAQEGPAQTGVNAVQGLGGSGPATVRGEARVSRGAAAGPSPQSDPDGAQGVVDQVARHLTAVRTLRDGTHRTVLHLSPEHLGAVQVTVDLLDGQVTLRLTAGDAALSALRGDMSELRAQLSQAGLELGDVDLRSWSSGDEPRRGAGQAPAHQGAADQNTADRNTAGNDPAGGNDPTGGNDPQDRHPAQSPSAPSQPRTQTQPQPQTQVSPGAAPGRTGGVDLRV